MPRRFRPIPARAIRVHLPDTTQQTDYSCGASCLQSVCKYYGVGPDDEWEFVEAIGLDRRVGSHPDELERAARRFGLRCKAYQPMSFEQLYAELRRRHPVLLMIQAWGTERRAGKQRPRRDYSGVWLDGHWVVAIGFDRDAVYLEDPSLQAVRGYLRNEELEARWHDTEHYGRHVERLGLAVWHPGRGRSAYEAKAERIQ